jgi:hypothetical protein
MVLSVFDCLFSDDGVDDEMDPAALGALFFLAEGRCGTGSDGFGEGLNRAASRSLTGAFMSSAAKAAMTALLKDDAVPHSKVGVGSRNEACDEA